MERRSSLATRKDVVNKTLLRAVKRFITEKFDEYTQIKSLQPTEQKEQFLELLNRFIFFYFPAISQVINEEGNIAAEGESVL
jgi:hypothetical protein